jgi:hypothetical protein
MTAGVASRPGIPWYVHPAENPSAWGRLGQIFSEADGLADGFVVVNVHNGPGKEDDPYYGPALQELRIAAPGLVTLGYVDVDYGRRGAEQVLGDAADWRRRYGLAGIMLDRFPSGDGPGHGRATQDALEVVARLRDSGAQHVAGNPGVVPIPDVRKTLDITCEFEGIAGEYLSSDLPGGEGSWHLVHSCSHDEIRRARAAARSTGAAHGYFTDAAPPHPWCGSPLAAGG